MFLLNGKYIEYSVSKILGNIIAIMQIILLYIKFFHPTCLGILVPIGLASKWILYFSKTFNEHSSIYGTRESLCWNLRTSFLLINSNIWIFGIVSIIFRLKLFFCTFKNNIFHFRHVLVKYSQGLVNMKGLITPLFEKLYILGKPSKKNKIKSVEFFHTF